MAIILQILWLIPQVNIIFSTLSVSTSVYCLLQIQFSTYNNKKNISFLMGRISSLSNCALLLGSHFFYILVKATAQLLPTHPCASLTQTVRQCSSMSNKSPKEKQDHKITPHSFCSRIPVFYSQMIALVFRKYKIEYLSRYLDVSHIFSSYKRLAALKQSDRGVFLSSRAPHKH